MAQIADLKGTSISSFQIEKSGVRLKNNTGNLQVRNSGDSDWANAALQDLQLRNSADSNVITLRRPTTTIGANYTLTLPTGAGSPNQVLTTDGSGGLSWTTPSGGGGGNAEFVDTTTLNFNSTSSVSMFTLPANAIVARVEVIIDTTWVTGTATMSVGISGSTSKYAGANLIDLYGTAKDKYIINPGEQASGSTEALIITYAANTSTAGSARVLVYYSNPA